jgi:transposase-like protein
MYRDIKRRCYDQFLAAKKRGKKFSFTTDKLAAYLKGFNKYFLHVAEIKHGVSIAFKKYGLKHNNNCIERDHQYSRRLESNARGHKSFSGASALFNLGDAYYNFIDKQRLEHERRWRTPAERAMIPMFLGEKQQLLNLIRLASVDN